MAKLHTEVKLEGAQNYALLIGIQARNLRGFIFLWTRLFGFIQSTQKAPGCLSVLPGISGPRGAVLMSYWESEASLKAFVRSPAHVRWMQFIYRHPESLDLFNETYGAPLRANFINQPRGYAEGLIESNSREK